MNRLADTAEDVTHIPTANNDSATAFVEIAYGESILNRSGEQPNKEDGATRESADDSAAAIQEPSPCISKTSVVGKRLWAKYYAAKAGLSIVPVPKPRRQVILEPIYFSLAFAREHGVTDAVINHHLQLTSLGKTAVVRNGRTWIPWYPLSEILTALPCFTNRQTIYEGLQRLEAGGHILSSSELKAIKAGRMKDGGYCLPNAPKPTKAMEGRTWYYVKPFTSFPNDLIAFDATDAKEHGMLKACILSKSYEVAADKGGWKSYLPRSLPRHYPTNVWQFRMQWRKWLLMACLPIAMTSPSSTDSHFVSKSYNLYLIIIKHLVVIFIYDHFVSKPYNIY